WAGPGYPSATSEHRIRGRVVSQHRADHDLERRRSDMVGCGLGHHGAERWSPSTRDRSPERRAAVLGSVHAVPAVRERAHPRWLRAGVLYTTRRRDANRHRARSVWRSLRATAIARDSYEALTIRPLAISHLRSETLTPTVLIARKCVAD